MGFDTMRMNSGRCPPFLVAGLLVMCVLLTCNWWTLSSQNYDILKELEEMGDQLRKCSSQKGICDNERSIMETRLQAAESVSSTNQIKLTREIDLLKEQVTNKDRTIKELETARDKATISLKSCQSELENIKQLDESRASVLALLRLEKTATMQQLQEQKDKVAELQEQLNKLNAKSSKLPQSNEQMNTPSLSPNLGGATDLKDVEEEVDARFDISSETPRPEPKNN